MFFPKERFNVSPASQHSFIVQRQDQCQSSPIHWKQPQCWRNVEKFQNYMTYNHKFPLYN